MIPEPKPAPLFRGHPVLGAGRLFKTRPLSALFEISDACGDVARLRFPVKPHTAHLLRHPDHVRHVLIDNVKNYGKQTRGYQKLRGILGAGLVTSEGDFWKRQRRIANPAFHRERIAHFGDVMVRCTTDMLDRWDEHIARGTPFDVSREMMRVTLRVIGLTMLSTDVEGAVLDGRRRRSITWCTSSSAASTASSTGPSGSRRAENRRYDHAREALDRVVNDVIAERRRTGEQKDDLLSMLMSARDPETGEGMSDVQLRDEVMTVFLAGHETTANALGWTLYLLSLHPDAERRMRQEVREVLGDRPPTVRGRRQAGLHRSGHQGVDAPPAAGLVHLAIGGGGRRPRRVSHPREAAGSWSALT